MSSTVLVLNGDLMVKAGLLSPFLLAVVDNQVCLDIVSILIKLALLHLINLTLILTVVIEESFIIRDVTEHVPDKVCEFHYSRRCFWPWIHRYQILKRVYISVVFYSFSLKVEARLECSKVAHYLS